MNVVNKQSDLENWNQNDTSKDMEPIDWPLNKCNKYVL